MLQTNFRLGTIVLRQKFNQVNVKIFLDHFDAVIVGAGEVAKCKNGCL